MFFFFFNDTATTEIYTLSLHDALPISIARHHCEARLPRAGNRKNFGLRRCNACQVAALHDRRWVVRSEEHRLNSSHQIISYAVFCLKKKKKNLKNAK